MCCRQAPAATQGARFRPPLGVCGIARFPGRCRHRPLRNIGQGPARPCRIPPPQAGNAPFRLRLTAHPPSGLRCPHRTARAEARLCSATVKPAPSRFLRRRRRSTPQPLAGEALGELLTGRLPCKGSCRRQPTEGRLALPIPFRAAARPPGGRERPPYNVRQTDGGTGHGRLCSRAARPQNMPGGPISHNFHKTARRWGKTGAKAAQHRQNFARNPAGTFTAGPQDAKIMPLRQAAGALDAGQLAAL